MRRSFYQLYASLTSRSTSGASFSLAITNESCVGFHPMKGQNQDFGAGSAFDGSAPLFANRAKGPPQGPRRYRPRGLPEAATSLTCLDQKWSFPANSCGYSNNPFAQIQSCYHCPANLPARRGRRAAGRRGTCGKHRARRRAAGPVPRTIAARHRLPSFRAGFQYASAAMPDLRRRCIPW